MRKAVLVYIFLFATGFFSNSHLAAEKNLFTPDHSCGATIIIPFTDYSGQPDSDFVFTENDINSSKHCDKVETPGIPVPVTYQLKNRNSCRFSNLFIVYLKRESSQININGSFIAAVRNISPLSVILLV